MMTVYYRWYDYWRKCFNETKCVVLNTTGKTATIRLKEFGRNGLQPGSVTRCRISSLRGYELSVTLIPEQSEQSQQWTFYRFIME